MDDHSFLQELGIKPINEGAAFGTQWLGTKEQPFISYSPVDGSSIAEIQPADELSYNEIANQAAEAFNEWRMIPAPQRGEIVRQIGEELRLKKELLGRLVSYEMGKSLQEGLGEVQEMIDICDFAVGLSRQLYGLTMHSERTFHRMYEQWHPLGIVGIISAFNFPVAVWSWNAAIAWVCGDVCIWKPSEKAPLTAIACQKIASSVFENHGIHPGVCNLIIGGLEIGKKLANDGRIPLISATGSTRMGKSVAEAVAKRLGKTILELGGNNAIIVTEHADLKVVIPAAVFGAVGTGGQRCTTTRRLIIHASLYDKVKEALKKAYGQLLVGNPLKEQVHMGPLIDQDAVNMYLRALDQILQQGGKAIVPGAVLEGPEYESGCYVKPAIYEVESDYPIVCEETFAPILYLMKYSSLEEAVTIQNSVPQGLSSAIMTMNMREAEYFLSHQGSDCGIANVNIGTSGAEIGGAFGGEKETGGGRESGSDAWKAYMRRQTNTINYSDSLPLAQGIKFDF